MKNLSAVKLFVPGVATVVMTLLLVGTVVFFEPPAFLGYAFGFLNGANWLALFVLYMRYWEEQA